MTSKSEQRAELERLTAEYTGPITRERQDRSLMTSEQREMLETEYLRRLMKRDAAIWASRQYTLENVPLGPPLDHESAMQMMAIRRAERIGRKDDV
jgi:hypothetical protein